MKPFSVDDIKDVFKADLESFINVTRQQLDRYLSPEGEVDVFIHCARNAHSMKGVAAMVHAWGLSHFGEDLESLYELAESLHNSERDRAKSIAGFVNAVIPEWEEMANLTLNNRLDEAYEIYKRVRGKADQQYDGYLPKRDAESGLNEKQTSPEESPEKMKPATEVAGVARMVSKPKFRVAEEQPAETSEAPEAHVLVSSGAAGVARKAAPPKLKIADGPSESEQEAAQSTVKPAADAAGVARRISKPKFKTAEDAPEETQSASESLKPTAEAAGVARKIAKPKMKVVDDELPQTTEPSPELAVAPTTTPALELPTATADEPASPIADTEGESTPADTSTYSPVDDELVSLFRGEALEYIQGLGVSLGQLRIRDDDETWSEVRRLCHTIKGSASMVGLNEVSERAKVAENLARAAEENKASRGTKQVAKLIQTVEQCAKQLGIQFKLIAPTEAPKAEAQKPSSPAIDRDLAQAFVMDANEQLESLETAVLTWEKGGDDEEQRNAAYRAYHTLKGAANSIGLTAVGAQIHHVEALLDAAGNGGVSQKKEMFSFLLATVDQLRKYSGELTNSPDAAWTLDWAQTVASLTGGMIAQPKQAQSEAKPAQDFEAELTKAFALDARDQAQQLEQAILDWERNNNPAEQIQATYRVFHTLKGAANSVGLKDLGDNFHAIESLLDRIGKSGILQPPTEVITFFLASVDDLTKFAAEVERNPKSVWPHDWKAESARLGALLGDAGTSDAIALPVVDEADVAPVQADYIRVEAARIRKLLNQVGEQVVERNRFASKLDRAIQLRQLLGGNRQRLVRLVENFQDQFEYSSARARSGGAGALRGMIQPPPSVGSNGSGTDEFSELEFDRYDEYNMLSRQLTEVADDLGQVTVELERLIESFRNDEQRFAANSKLMQQDITTLTSQPIEGLFRRLDRIFRDAVQSEQKDAALKFEGIGATLDRSIIDRLYTPLLHIVRNAVAHGLETPEEREATGKPRQGTVTVGASQSSNQIIITIKDDGRGVDAAKVLARAKERGLINAEVSDLPMEKVLDVLFTPGFSTAAEVTSIAGRGVGLDVVKKEIESINGSVSMETETGSGTTWRLQLPLTLAVSEAVIVGLGSQEYAIPLNFVTTGMLLTTNQIFVRDGTEFYNVAGEDLRLIRLARLFGGEEEIADPRGVILSVGDQRCVLMVDRVPARREIVVKGFDPLLARHSFLEGATLDSEGRPVLILSAPALIRFSGAVARVDAPKVAAVLGSAVPSIRKGERKSGKLTALVVDDSLSVRTVQDRLLSELGLEVVLASDGLDALDKLRVREVDIIFTDLEMPRMNGYDLISTVRSNSSWANIPMVLVTSRAGQKHLDKAKELGCNGFLVKPFTQDDLAAQLSEHAAYEGREAVLK
jgi:chemosensory pili system protein ChpA (sensor histidine kinase/response regulator)